MKSGFYWCLIPALAAAIFVGAPLLARLHIIHSFHAFIAWLTASIPALAAVILGVYLVFAGEKGQGAATLFLGAGILAAFAAGYLRGREFPRINDITTNLDSPPPFANAAAAPENQGKDLAYPEAFKPLVQAGYPGLISLQIPLASKAAFALVEQVARAQPHWRLVRTDAGTLTIEGEETAGLFQFTDDFVIRVLPLDDSAQIDMRSRSRVGTSDFGANARRIEGYFVELDKALRGAPGRGG